MQIFKSIEKSEFQMLIKHCFLRRKKTLFKQNNGLISVIQTLLHWKQWLRGGMLTLNTVIQTQMMLNAQVAQIRQLSQKTPKPHKLILADCKLKMHEIAEELKISECSVFTILHEHLSIRKLCSKWVLHLLTVNQNQQRVEDSEHCLQMFQLNKKEFLWKYVTMDETWIHHFGNWSLFWGQRQIVLQKWHQIVKEVLASVSP